METEEKSLAGSLPDKSQVAAEVLGNTSSASESPTSPRKEPGITLCIEEGTQEMINGVTETLNDTVEGYTDAETVVSVSNHGLDGDTVTSSTEAGHFPERENHGYEFRNPDSLVHELESSNVTTKESKEEPEMDDVLKSVLGFQPNTSAVDFLAPVLDVKFNSERKVSDSKCLFEALFTEEFKTVVVDCNKEGFGDDNLVSVEDEEELKGPPTDTLSSLELDCYETNEMHLQLNDCNNGGYGGNNLVSVEDEELKGPPTDTLSSLEMDHYARNEVLQNDIDLLNPPAELEKRKHKLKRLVQSPNSFFMVLFLLSLPKTRFDAMQINLIFRFMFAGRQVPGMLQHGYTDAETVVSVSNHGLDGDTVTSSTEAGHFPERENHGYEFRNPDSLVHELESSNVTTKESKEEPEMDDVLKSVLGFQPNTSAVDFLAPVLDVKFNSERKVSDSKCLFEALFTEEFKTVVVDCDKEGFGDDNLVSVEDEEELKGPPTDTLSSLELDCYETNEMHVQLNGVNVEGFNNVVVDCNNGGYGGDNLVSVEDEELKGPPTDTLSSLEMDHYATNEVLLQLNVNTKSSMELIIMVLQNDIDLLNPPAELEKRKHKLKRLVQSPNSFFMDVKCQGCFNM
ncbi:hypothetical protein F2Q68_00036474 [Brassica cretica]|uniref:Uncharacterized protein n=1 Tax=Brassica cretica TaxID=69181 RepID=A0A8S9H5Y3_BRACR|nr:hypothetical protein F2Q68_00036474 [Brassica cretica]